ncbi:MAG: CPBP family intramembrane metalloprotease [Treponema sp.]|nr:CPBP family intramembrane metalloprotease [Treponema sp.]
MNLLQKIRKNGAVTRELHWWDIAILTVILFGGAVYTSTTSFFYSSAAHSFEKALEFSANDNYRAFATQAVLLCVALLYLWLRRFDFSQWHMRITFKAVLFGCALFIAVSLAMDIFYITVAALLHNPLDLSATEELANVFPTIDVSLVLYSLLNGFYEELYFLGICLAVPQEKLKFAFLFSLIVRFSFHTYQGIVSAVGIAVVVGIVFFVLYEKTSRKNLIPFFAAHALADVFGAGVLDYFFARAL